MDYEFRELKRRIEWTYWKWRRLVVIRWLSLTLLTIGLTLAITAFLDWRLLLPEGVRIALLAASAAVVVWLFWYALVRPLRHRPSFDRIARHIEEHHPELEDRLVTAVEFGDQAPSWASPKLLNRLIQDAALRTSSVNFGGTISGKGTAWLSLASAVAVIVVLSYLLPQLRLHGLEMRRITRPWQTPNPRTEPGILVAPGNKKVPRGSQEMVSAQITGLQPEAVTFYFSSNDTSWQKAEMEVTEQPNRFVFNVLDIEEPIRYYVKAGELLSEIYTLSVFDPPRVLRLDLTYRFPDYARLQPKFERDGGDIWAPAGTSVTVRAITDRPVAGGELRVGDSRRLKARIQADTVAVATFKVEKDGFYRFSVWDDGGVRSVGDPEYYINVIPDEPPQLTLLRPGADRKATKIEEVTVRVEVADDFGLASLKLTYSLNDGALVTVDLLAKGKIDTLAKEAGARLTAEYTFFLEDLGVKPGDFLSYFVEAADRTAGGAERTIDTDIYFLEVRPFEQEFFRAVAQQGGGMQGGSQFQLAVTQKEIITATWKLERRRERLSEDAFEEARQALATTQKNLREGVDNIVDRMQERSIFSAEKGGKIMEYLSSASVAMQRAEKKLDDGDLAAAQGPEKEAYHFLLRAEAENRRRQLARASASSGAQIATAQELAQLFQEELDKIDNRYETLQQQQSQKAEAELDKALQKVKELARRQEQLNRANRDLARRKLSPEERRRQIDQLRRRQEQLNRDAQRLARQMDQLRRSSESLSGSTTEDLRQAASEMSNASNSLRQLDPDRAAAKGSKALDRLRRLEQQLQQGQKRSLAQRLDRLQDRLNQLQNQEDRLLRELQALARDDSTQRRREASQALAAAKRAMRRDTQEIEKELREAALTARQAKSELSRELRRLARRIEEDRLSERMAESEALLEQQRLASATELEKITQRDLSRLARDLQGARDLLAASDQERLQQALDRTRSLRDQLESLTRSAQKKPQPQALAERQRDRRRSAESRQGETGNRSQSGQQGGQQTSSGSDIPSQGSLSNERLSRKDLEKLRESLWRGLGDLRTIGESVRVDTSLHDDFRKLLSEWSGMVRNFRGGSPERLRDVEKRILVPLREFEAEIEQRLQLMESKEKLFFTREEKVPAEYREYVEKYYEALSKGKRRP